MLSICAFYLCRAEEQRALRKKARKKNIKKKNPEKKKLAKKKNICSEWYLNLYESAPQIRSQVLYPFGYGVTGKVDVVLPIYQFHLSARGAVYLVILI